MYCHNCGTKLPDDSAFCPNCGQAVPGSSSTNEPRYKVNNDKRVGLLNDPYKEDRRFKALTFYVLSVLIAAFVSTFIICGIYMDGTAMDIYYEYLYRNHYTRTWEFVGGAAIWLVLCLAIAIIVSYRRLKEAFQSAEAAKSIIMYGKLESSERRFNHDDIELVNYFMKRYGHLSKGAWTMPVVLVLIAVFLIPRLL